jgi:hypothetical protein
MTLRGIRVKSCPYLLILVIFTLGVMDTVSTVIAMSDTGFTGYESNAIYSFIYANHGIDSFIALKLIVTTCLAVAAFFIQQIYDELKTLYVSVSIGLVAVGIFVTASNLSIAMGGNAISVFSMDPSRFSLFCLMCFLFFGLMLTILQNINFGEHKPIRAMYKDQFGMWLPYEDD